MLGYRSIRRASSTELVRFRQATRRSATSLSPSNTQICCTADRTTILNEVGSPAVHVAGSAAVTMAMWLLALALVMLFVVRVYRRLASSPGLLGLCIPGTQRK